MANKFQVTDEQINILREAIAARVLELDKIATSLMKKRLPDAAAPVYQEIKRLQRMGQDLGVPPSPKKKAEPEDE